MNQWLETDSGDMETRTVLGAVASVIPIPDACTTLISSGQDDITKQQQRPQER